MNVLHILKAKGRAVETIAPHATLADAAIALTERGIGALVVTGVDGRVSGIVSERDIVRALAGEGAEALEAPVSAHMTCRVETTSEDETVARVMERMTEGRFRHMPVVEDGRLAGIVSVGDIVKHRLSEIAFEAESMRAYIATA